jgi:hypothetical protein
MSSNHSNIDNNGGGAELGTDPDSAEIATSLHKKHSISLAEDGQQDGQCPKYDEDSMYEVSIW